MKQKFEEIYSELIFSEYGKSLKGKYCYACSNNHVVNTAKMVPLLDNCLGQRNLSYCSAWSSITKMKGHLAKMTEEEILRNLNMLISGQIPGQTLSDLVLDLLFKQIEFKTDYKVDVTKSDPIYKLGEPLKDYKPVQIIENIDANDIPNLSKRESQNANKFASLYNLFYHLEVSIRNYLRKRLRIVLTESWEQKLKEEEIIIHAFRRKADIELSEYYQKRGNDILNYCNWVDYGRIIELDAGIWNRKTSKNEFIAHLDSMYKIRNAIAHNAENLPQEMFKELEVFVIKFIKIFKESNR